MPVHRILVIEFAGTLGTFDAVFGLIVLFHTTLSLKFATALRAFYHAVLLIEMLIPSYLRREFSRTFVAFEAGSGIRLGSGIKLLGSVIRLLGSGIRLLESGIRLLKSGIRLLKSGIWLLKSRIRRPKSGIRLLRSRIRLLGSGIRLLVSGIRLLRSLWTGVLVPPRAAVARIEMIIHFAPRFKGRATVGAYEGMICSEMKCQGLG